MNPDRALRVAIVNDYEVVVAGLARMLAPFRDRIEVVELDVNRQVAASVDIALYDTFAQTNGARIDRSSVVTEYGAERLVVFTWNIEPHLAADAMDAGADGYLSKAVSADELVVALEKIHGGERVVLGVPVDEVSDQRDWPGRAAGLSERESQIIALITQGLSNDEVAGRAFLSINTVKSYIRSSYRKMGVTSRSRAVLWGLDHGFRTRHARITRDSDAL